MYFIYLQNIIIYLGSNIFMYVLQYSCIVYQLLVKYKLTNNSILFLLRCHSDFQLRKNYFCYHFSVKDHYKNMKFKILIIEHSQKT